MTSPSYPTRKDPVAPPTSAQSRPPVGSSGKSNPAIDSKALFAGHRELVILHNADRYVLRITRQGKLILNK